MLNIPEATELMEKLRAVAEDLDNAAMKDESLAEKVLDFERGLAGLPELTAMAREVLA